MVEELKVMSYSNNSNFSTSASQLSNSSPHEFAFKRGQKNQGKNPNGKGEK